jgi:dCMP deaminase
MSRQSWTEYLLAIAQAVSTRATCDRLHVGCVLVDDGHTILATGYNGSVRGREHCDDVGHDMVEGHCVRTVHAEANAIAQAASNGVRIWGATAFITAYPCWQCAKLLANAGVVHVVCAKAYRIDERVAKVLYVDIVRGES